MRQRPSPAAVSPASRTSPPESLDTATMQTEWLASPEVAVEEHLAIDEALLDEAECGLRLHRTVRTWMAAEFTVVVGSSSRLEDEVDVEACRAAGVRVMRRPTGGATVVLGPGCLMWSVITPFPEAPPSVESLHSSTLNPLCDAFAAAGVAVARKGTSDLAVGERKVSGNALRIRKHAVLYHGTLLDRFDIEAAMRLLKHPPREPTYRGGRPHTAFLANLQLGRAPLEHLVQRAFRVSGQAAACDPQRVAALLTDRYRCDAWHTRL